jgi:hypothetical protein
LFLSTYGELPFTDQLLHGVHFMLCAFAVLIACIPLMTEKGSTEHKFGGALYVPVSCAAFALASYMAWSEGSLVLLCFNGFCAYLLLSGIRAMHEKEKPALIDWVIPGGLFILAAGATLHALIYDEGKRSFYLLFFALNAFYLAGRDFRHLRRRSYWFKRKIFLLAEDMPGSAHAADWLNRHITGMVGSVIANLSVVVLTLLPIEWHWIWPTVLILTAAGIGLRERHKKLQLRRAIPPLFRPQPSYGVVRPRRNDEDEDIRKAA